MRRKPWMKPWIPLIFVASLSQGASTPLVLTHCRFFENSKAKNVFAIAASSEAKFSPTIFMNPRFLDTKRGKQPKNPKAVAMKKCCLKSFSTQLKRKLAATKNVEESKFSRFLVSILFRINIREVKMAKTNLNVAGKKVKKNNMV